VATALFTVLLVIGDTGNVAMSHAATA